MAPFIWDAGLAKFAVAAGYHAVYMTGFGTAFTYGLPDIGLLGLDEMVSNAGRIAASVDVPLIADVDTDGSR
jgi:2-methylisocitrate lyase-like PEP mutase family enzyme